MLRAYRDGEPIPRAFGYVILGAFQGWPTLNGPKLEAAQVTISNGRKQYRTTTRSDGSFAFNDAPAGEYSLDAKVFPFAPILSAVRLVVPPVGCGTADFPMMATSSISGVVLDHTGHPAAQIPVDGEMLDTAIQTKTDIQGNFTLRGIPDMDVRLVYGSSYPSSEGVLYPRVFAKTLRLHPGQHDTGLVLWLPAPPKILSIAVTVLKKDGSPADGAYINANLNGTYVESSKSGPTGRVRLACLGGFAYQLEAHMFAQHGQSFDKVRNQPVPFVCGKDLGPYVLRLDHESRY